MTTAIEGAQVPQSNLDDNQDSASAGAADGRQLASNQTEDQDQRLEESPAEARARAQVRSWLGKVLNIEMTDGRVIVGYFVCTDRDANVILENSQEYGPPVAGNEEPRMLGLVLIPGKHIVSVHLMT